MMSMLLSEMIAIIPLLAFQIRSALVMLKNYLHWIIEYCTLVVCHAFPGHVCSQWTFLKHIAVLGEGDQVFCIWHFRGSLVVITFEKKKWLTG